MPFEIRPITAKDTDEWDRLVESSPHGSIFHSSYWIAALGDRCDLWGIYRGNELEGGFVAPFMKVAGARILRSRFLTPYSGLVVRNQCCSLPKQLSFESRIVTTIAPFLKSTYRWGTSALDPRFRYVLPFLWKGFAVRVRFTYVLSLSDVEAIWEGMDGGVRNDVSKARRSGLTVVSEESALRLIPLLRVSYRRRGAPFREEAVSRYLSALTAKSRCRTFVCVDSSGRETAASMIIWDSKRAYNIFNAHDGVDSEHRGAMSLCIFESIQYASRFLGLEAFDFEGSMIPTVERFFRKFGGKPQPYYELRWGHGVDSLMKWNRVVGRYLRPN